MLRCDSGVTKQTENRASIWDWKLKPLAKVCIHKKPDVESVVQLENDRRAFTPQPLTSQSMKSF